MNGSPSHVGDLDELFHLTDEDLFYDVIATRPTLFGDESINGKTLVLYEGNIVLGPGDSGF